MVCASSTTPALTARAAVPRQLVHRNTPPRKKVVRPRTERFSQIERKSSNVNDTMAEIAMSLNKMDLLEKRRHNADQKPDRLLC